MDMYLQAREREFETTKKVLNAFPKDKTELKPAEKSKSAGDLAWTFVIEERLLQSLLTGGSWDFRAPAPKTIAETIKIFEKEYGATNKILQKMTVDDFKKTAEFFVAPKTKGQIPKENLKWMMLMDQIHHRGQFSVYLRIAGAKVPSIYGPTADEPWM